MSSRLFALLLLVCSIGCRSAATTPPRVATAPVPPAGVSAPARDPDSIRWVRDAAEYRAAVLQIYRQATSRVESEASGRISGSWAVVLDADETVLDNATYQLERARQGFAIHARELDGTGSRRRPATPVPGAATFLGRVRALGGRIAIVTNRLQSECADTIAFSRFTGLRSMRCCAAGRHARQTRTHDSRPSRPDEHQPAQRHSISLRSSGTTSSTSRSSRKRLQPPATTAFSDFGVRYFLIPNPMYGSWQ